MVTRKLVGWVGTLLGTTLVVLTGWGQIPQFVEHSALIAAVGAMLAVIALPYAVMNMNGMIDDAGRPISPWYYMLSEPHGGWSLARVQLLIWFLPTFGIYLAFSVRDGQFAPMNQTIAILLGLGGATTLLSTAASPPTPVSATTQTSLPGTGRTVGTAPGMGSPAGPAAPGALAPQGPAAASADPVPDASGTAVYEKLLKAYHDAATSVEVNGNNPVDPTGVRALQSFMEVAPAVLAIQGGVVPAPLAATASQSVSGATQIVLPTPDARDLVTDFDGHGDVSRYQYLLLCIFGAGILLMQSAKTGQVPELPTEFLYLVGASQAAYLGAKAVKQSQASK